MRCAGRSAHQTFEFHGVEKIHAIVAAEGAALDLEPVVAPRWVTFLRVDDKRTCLCKSAIRAQIDAMVANQPQTRFAVVDLGKPAMGIAKPAVSIGVSDASSNNAAHGLNGKSQHRLPLTLQSHREDGEAGPGAWR